MTRTINEPPPEPLILQAEELYPGTIAKTYTVSVITPIFGGGAETGVNDPVTLIRPSSIRGHLRFWWRATRGALCNTVKELRQREGEIWGTTERPSSVSVEVQIVNPGTEEACAVLQPGRTIPKFHDGYPPYALFPFQGNAQDRIPPAKARKNVKFSLTLRYPALAATEVQAALWAWMNFGGIGARTRRGCGALYCSEFAPPSVSKVTDWLAHARRSYALPIDKQMRAWPTFPVSCLTSKTSQSAIAAWHNAIEILREFRQGAGVGRNTGQSPSQPGRSRWPEADSLRALTEKGDPRHSTSITITNPRDNPAFPRAALGLPIVFHFKDSADSPNNSELYPKGQTRMASSVILRPLAIGTGDQAVALVAQLTTPRLEVVELKKVLVPLELTASHLARPELAQYDKSPLAKRSTTGSALDAFIAFAKEKGFQECKP